MWVDGSLHSPFGPFRGKARDLQPLTDYTGLPLSVRSVAEQNPFRPEDLRRPSVSSRGVRRSDKTSSFSPGDTVGGVPESVTFLEHPSPPEEVGSGPGVGGLYRNAT